MLLSPRHIAPWFLVLLVGCQEREVKPTIDGSVSPDRAVAADQLVVDVGQVDGAAPDLAVEDLGLADRGLLDLALPDRLLPWKDIAVADIPQGTVAELVTCRFNNSTSMQQCYSSTGPGCSGVSTCVVKMSGASGTAVTWKSTCGGYAYTTLDGKDEAAVFTCKPVYKDLGPAKDKATLDKSTADKSTKDVSSGTVSELVTCRFVGSAALQNCYSSLSNTCSGVATCTVTVTGKAGTAMTWKSSCGGYAYTTLDGKDEPAAFKCP